jgi:hypothetical protein
MGGLMDNHYCYVPRGTAGFMVIYGLNHSWPSLGWWMVPGTWMED